MIDERRRGYAMETQETYLIVVVFCSVYDGDVSSMKRFSCVLETVVQLLGDAKSAGAFFRAGFSLEYTGIAYNHVAANSDAPPPRTTILNLSLVGASVLSHRVWSIAIWRLRRQEIPRFACVCILRVLKESRSVFSQGSTTLANDLATLWTLMGTFLILSDGAIMPIPI
jgi:hypothetical protein